MVDLPGDHVVTIDVSKYVIERAALDLATRELCLKNRFIPVALLDNVLVVAMANPRDEAARSELSIMTKRRVEPVRADPNDVDAAIVRYYGPAGV